MKYVKSISWPFNETVEYQNFQLKEIREFFIWKYYNLQNFVKIEIVIKNSPTVLLYVVVLMTHLIAVNWTRKFNPK